MSVHTFVTGEEAVCDSCGDTIDPKTAAYYDTEEGKTYCADCVEGD